MSAIVILLRVMHAFIVDRRISCHALHIDLIHHQFGAYFKRSYEPSKCAPQLAPIMHHSVTIMRL